MRREKRIHEVYLDNSTKVQYYNLDLARREFNKVGRALVTQLAVGFEIELKGSKFAKLKVASREAVNQILRNK